MSDSPLVGTFDMRDQVAARDRIRQLREQLQSEEARFARLVAPLTYRGIDSALPAGQRTYFGAKHLIDVAVENYEAVFDLISAAGLRPFAVYSLLRPAFETALLSVWMLESPESKERRWRGLQWAANDYRERSNWIDAVRSIPAVTEEQLQGLLRDTSSLDVYSAEAIELGKTWGQAKTSIGIINVIEKLKAEGGANDLVRATLKAAWRQLSGYEHGFPYAALAGSHLGQQRTISGGVEVLLSIDDNQFALSMQTVSLLLNWSLQLYIGRTIRTPRQSGSG